MSYTTGFTRSRAASPRGGRGRDRRRDALPTVKKPSRDRRCTHAVYTVRVRTRSGRRTTRVMIIIIIIIEERKQTPRVITIRMVIRLLCHDDDDDDEISTPRHDITSNSASLRGTRPGGGKTLPPIFKLWLTISDRFQFYRYTMMEIGFTEAVVVMVTMNIHRRVQISSSQSIYVCG